MTHRVLIADDEKEIRDLLKLYLEDADTRVLEAEDGDRALEILRSDRVDLCVLDVMMPGTDGFHVLREIRTASNIPVLMLSARDQQQDKILGLNLGADDYISKPFDPLEATARIHAALRRYYGFGTADGAGENADSLKLRDLTLDRNACTLFRDGKEIPLTSVEYRIMELLMRNPGRVYTKQQLFEQGWEETCAVSDNSIMVCISKLRAKLDEDPNRYIRTIRGLGYRLEKAGDGAS